MTVFLITIPYSFHIMNSIFKYFLHLKTDSFIFPSNFYLSSAQRLHLLTWTQFLGCRTNGKYWENFQPKTNEWRNQLNFIENEKHLDNISISIFGKCVVIILMENVLKTLSYFLRITDRSIEPKYFTKIHKFMNYFKEIIPIVFERDWNFITSEFSDFMSMYLKIASLSVSSHFPNKNYLKVWTLLWNDPMIEKIEIEMKIKWFHWWNIGIFSIL